MEDHLFEGCALLRRQQSVEPRLYGLARPGMSRRVGFRRHEVVDSGEDGQSAEVAEFGQGGCWIGMDLIP